MSQVRSVDPESTTTISSAQRTLSSTRPRFDSSLSATMAMESVSGIAKDVETAALGCRIERSSTVGILAQRLRGVSRTVQARTHLLREAKKQNPTTEDNRGSQRKTTEVNHTAQKHRDRNRGDRNTNTETQVQAANNSLAILCIPLWRCSVNLSFLCGGFASRKARDTRKR